MVMQYQVLIGRGLHAIPNIKNGREGDRFPTCQEYVAELSNQDDSRFLNHHYQYHHSIFCYIIAPGFIF